MHYQTKLVLYPWHIAENQVHGRSQNAGIDTYIKGRQLKRAVIIIIEVPFHIGIPLKGMNLLPEGANSFPWEQSLLSGKPWFPHMAILLEYVQFLLNTCITSYASYAYDLFIHVMTSNYSFSQGNVYAFLLTVAAVLVVLSSFQSFLSLSQPVCHCRQHSTGLAFVLRYV